MDKNKMLRIAIKVIVYLAVFAYFWINVPKAC